jgi:hypothetical protein
MVKAANGSPGPMRSTIRVAATSTARLERVVGRHRAGADSAEPRGFGRLGAADDQEEPCAASIHAASTFGATEPMHSSGLGDDFVPGERFARVLR